MQRLWLVIGGIAATLALAMGTYSAVSVIAHEEVVERRTFDAAGLTAVDLRGENGNVEIVGADVEEISLVAEIDHGLRRTEYSAVVDGTTLVVRDDCPPAAQVWCRVDHRLVVPNGLTIDVRSDNGRITGRDLSGQVTVRGRNGSVELARIAGDLDVRTDNGRIEARGVSGASVRAHTDNGRIELGFADAPRVVDTKSHNGSIDIVVPDDGTAYRLDIDTRFTGSIDAAIRTDPTSEHFISARTSNGSVTVRYPTG